MDIEWDEVKDWLAKGIAVLGLGLAAMEAYEAFELGAEAIEPPELT